MKMHYQHDLVVKATVAEDISVAELRVVRCFTDGTQESAGVILTPADFDTTADLKDVMKEMLVNLVEQL